MLAASCEETEAHPLPFPVVGVGASAGGLEAIRELLREVPADANLAFLIVMHLDPAQPSQLTEILGRSTQMKAVVAVDDAEIQKGTIYVIPPNTSMSVHGGRIRLLARDRRLGPPMPVDDLLDSLAADQRTNAVGVILSGSGSDGAIGLQAVKECGGTAFVQDESSALFGSMPRTAMSLGCVDGALSPAAIGRELVRLAHHPFLNSAAAEAEDPLLSDKVLAQILKELKRTCNIDFSHYKRGTLERRIARRVALRDARSIQEYLPLLENESAEAVALCGDLLIKYTRFFRDPDSFEALTETVLPRLLRSSDDGPVRVWVPGCSTGEEVYSIAIVMAEYLERAGRSPKFQIFATDISEDALETARAGRYIENIERDVSPERLRRFFNRDGAYYRISKSLRECCTFARQNVVYDAPFSRINLISCRNLLIYLDAALQRRVLPFFHFSLVPDGVLMLGMSETAGPLSDAFAPLDDGRSRIFVKKPLPSRPQDARPDPRSGGSRPVPLDRAARLPPHERLRAEFDRIVLSRFAPACVLCDDDLNIVEFKGDTSAFLLNPAGPPTLQLPRLVRPELLPAVSDALRQVRKEGIPARRNGVRIHLDGEIRTADLEVVPVRPQDLDGSWYVIIFHRSTAAATAPRSSNVASLWRGVPARLFGRSTPDDRGGQEEVARLSEELRATREQNRLMLEEHESALEELRAMEEETLASNEEFQSTNEELVSAKEEQQSINEELATTNDELRYRNQELKDLHGEITQARDYAEAILETMAEPLLVLDSNLRVSRANRAYYDTFRTTPRDTLHCELYALSSHQWDILALRKLLEELLPKRTQVRDFDLTASIPRVGVRSLRVNARRVAWPEHAFILMTFEDTTERDQALQQLIDGSRHKDEFLAMLAHELRNPLAAMRNALEIWKGNEGFGGGREEAQQVLERQLQHQVRLVDDLLDVSRITQGLVMIKAKPVDLAQPIRYGQVALRRQIAERGHQVRLMLPDEKIMVNGDTARLEQIVSNLLSNAVKYTPDGGTIDISLERDQDMAVMSISDSGVGMSADFLDKAFGIFVQAEKQLDRALGGLGVGLTLVRRLVELHGGTVEARSPGLGQGSTFVVRLPLISAEQRLADIADEGELQRPARPRRVLVVDDNEDVATTTAILLEMSGHRVATAKDGPSTLALLAEFDPEVVLLDIGLPGMDGYEVCRRIRESAPHPNLLIIAVSGYGGQGEVAKAMEAGFDRHLTKPATLEQIAAVFRLYDDRDDLS